MEITKKEIQVFREITLNTPRTLSELAGATSTSQSYISTTLTSMGKKGLTQKTRNGKNKTPHLADTPHAIILRNMILNTPQTSLDYLANKGTKILTYIVCQNIRTLDELGKVSGISSKTIWRFMDRARGLGLVNRRKTITVNPRHEQVARFVHEYTSYIHETDARKHAHDALLKWSCGDTFIFETKTRLNLQRTGISAFQDHGALFLTLKNLYTSSNETLKLEDHMVNHILSEGRENILPLLITWRLNKDSIDTRYIQGIAFKYRVSDVSDAVERYLETEGKLRTEYLINWSEFNDKYKEYQT